MKFDILLFIRNIYYKKAIKAHTFSKNNVISLINSKICGCFYCNKIFDPKEINQYTDSGNTAKCPYCEIDSILSEDCGYPITKRFLQKMHNYWFKHFTDLLK